MDDIKENNLGKICTFFFIRNDAETILSLLKSESDPVFALCILPYYALFYSSCSEYLNLPLSETDIKEKIYNIRHYIKSLSNRFTKSSKKINSTDTVQNDSFRNQLKYDFLRDTNIHYNLGLFFDESKKIITNTQLIADCFGIEDIYNNEQELRKKQQAISEELGAFVSSVSQGISDKISPPVIIRQNNEVKIPYYYDLNTNTTDFFYNKNNEKEINLFFLYLISNLNFVHTIIKNLVLIENPWAFRIKYIVNYYTIKALQRYKDYCIQNKYNNSLGDELNEILSFSEPLFDSKFRNCMMHYGITDEIKREFFNLDKPLFGLVESCFDGMDYYVFNEKQDALSKMIIECLEKQFNFDSIDIKKL